MCPACYPVKEVDAPEGSGVAPWYADADLVDAFATDLPLGTSSDPMMLAEAVFATQPAWIGALLGLRDALVGPLGLKTTRELRSSLGRSGAQHVGVFRVFAVGAQEVVLGGG